MVEENTQTIVEPNNFTLTIKMNAKREVYGEYTVKADTFEELEERSARAQALFGRRIGL